MSPEYEQIQLNFHLTSVYDHSLHEAFSRVLHKLIESLPFLEELLNVFCAVRSSLYFLPTLLLTFDLSTKQHSQSPKAFLFDTRSRLYVATDASPVDSATHNLCCDYLQMLNSFGPLYRYVTFRILQNFHLHFSSHNRSITETPPRQRHLTGEALPNTPPPSSISASSFSPPEHSASSSVLHSPALSIHQLPTNGSSHSSPTPPTPTTPRGPFNGGLTPVPTQIHFSGSSPSVASQTKLTPPTISPSSSSNSGPVPANSRASKRKELFYPSASTTLAASSSPSGGTTTLTYHLITKNLALLALIPTGVYEERRGLVEYNVVFFREGVQEISDLEEEVRVAG